jgi:hypothetical protein
MHSNFSGDAYVVNEQSERPRLQDETESINATYVVNENGGSNRYTDSCCDQHTYEKHKKTKTNNIELSEGTYVVNDNGSSDRYADSCCNQRPHENAGKSAEQQHVCKRDDECCRNGVAYLSL